MPPGAAYFAPNPAVIQTGDRKNGTNFFTLGWIDGITCTAEDPPPITATVLSVRS
jgi:hypothetical protein